MVVQGVNSMFQIFFTDKEEIADYRDFCRHVDRVKFRDFAVRLMDAGTPLRVQKQGVIEIRLEIENLGGDTDLIQADEDATPRIVALSSFASSAPVGDLLRPRPTGWNGWTGVRWKSHAVGELRVPMEARVFKGLAHLAGPGDAAEQWHLGGRRRHEDHAIGAGLVHFRQQLVLAQWRTVRLGARGPRTLRRIGCPDMDLSIGNQH